MRTQISYHEEARQFNIATSFLSPSHPPERVGVLVLLLFLRCGLRFRE